MSDAAKLRESERQEDEEWRARNHRLGDRAEEIADTDPLMAIALLAREAEFEIQRLKWKEERLLEAMKRKEK